MKTYRINKDMTVDEIDVPVARWMTADIVWAIHAFDEVNDIYYDDEGIYDPDVITASIGRHARVPLPAYVVGSAGEHIAEPTIPIELVRLSVS